MGRRGPPSNLRLFRGPLPPRSQPKHTLPSIPLPVFRPEASLPHGPTSVPRMREAIPNLAFSDLPPLSFELAAPSSSGNSTPTSSPKRARGPWDDASCFEYVVDVDSILALPKPVAMAL